MSIHPECCTASMRAGLIAVLLGACAGPDAELRRQHAQAETAVCEVEPAPRPAFDPFYDKLCWTGGIPILASDKVRDTALVEAHEIASAMLAPRPDVRRAMERNGLSIVIIGFHELVTHLPEYDVFEADPPGPHATRRGFASYEEPLIVVAEENLLCIPGDTNDEASIFVHEFAHAILRTGLADTDRTFRRRVERAYRDATRAGLWRRTYAAKNLNEYWAEGVRYYFDADHDAPGSADNNHVNTRAELRVYDPKLYALAAEVFGDATVEICRPIAPG